MSSLEANPSEPAQEKLNSSEIHLGNPPADPQAENPSENAENQLENQLRRTILDYFVKKTKISARYEKSYGAQAENLKAAVEGRDLNPAWAITKDSTTPSDSPRLFAVDCEMAETKTDDSKLVRVSVVEYNWETESIDKKYDEIVKPEATDSFTDFRTSLHGLKPHEIFGAKTTFTEAQNAILSLISSRDYIVGHSLDSDLKSLKIAHELVIDTANIFSIKTHPRRNLALRDLAAEILQTEDCQPIGASHDSIDDAAWALKVLLHSYKLIRGNQKNNFELESLPKRYMLELNIFGIPEVADHMAIMGLFPGCTSVHQRPIVFKTRPQDPRHKLGSTTFTFATEEDAKRGFVQLPHMDYNQDAEGFWKKKTALFIKGRQFGVWVKTHDPTLTPPPSDLPLPAPNVTTKTLPLPPPQLAPLPSVQPSPSKPSATVAAPEASKPSPAKPSATEASKQPPSASSTPGQSSGDSDSETEGKEGESGANTPKSKKKNKKNKKKGPSTPTVSGGTEVTGDKRRNQSSPNESVTPPVSKKPKTGGD